MLVLQRIRVLEHIKSALGKIRVYLFIIFLKIHTYFHEAPPIES